MPLLNENRIRIQLDAVERKKVIQLKKLVPEYSDLEYQDIIHLELKDKLLKRVRDLSRLPNASFVQSEFSESFMRLLLPLFVSMFFVIFILMTARLF